MSRFVIVCAFLATCVIFTSAKQPKLDANSFFDSVFKLCKTPRAERSLLLKLEKPSPEQAECFVKESYKLAGFVNPDGTADTKKVAQQFIDYGYDVPKDIDDHANINIEKDTKKFVDKVFAFYSKNRDDIRNVFFGIKKGEKK